MRIIPLGTMVRDKVTGFIGVAENRATFMYGCDRYCVQPMVGEDGKIPEPAMIDEPQLHIIEGTEQVMEPLAEPEQLVKLGQWVDDPVRGIGGTAIGRAVYLNGCSRICIQPKQVGDTVKEAFWTDEKQVIPGTTFFGKEKIVREPDVKMTMKNPGGPAPSSSKY